MRMRIQRLWTHMLKKGPMLSLGNAAVTKKEGISGDYRGKGGLLGKRQITILSLEQWMEACREIGQNILSSERRANIVTTGHKYGPEDVGKQIRFEGGVILEITGETTPCDRMDKVYPGLRKVLANWRGGATCKVIEGGVLRELESFTIE